MAGYFKVKNRPKLAAAILCLAAVVWPPSFLLADSGDHSFEISDSNIIRLSAPAVKTGSGGGLSVQSLFYPQQGSDEPKRFGNIYALFLDKWGQTREDSNGNQALDQLAAPNQPDGSPASSDLIVGLAQADNGRLSVEKRRAETGLNEISSRAAPGRDGQIKALWNAGELLSAFDNQQVTTSRLYLDPVLPKSGSLSGGRRIYTAVDAAAVSGREQKPAGTEKLILFNSEASAVLGPLIFENKRPDIPVSFPGPSSQFYLSASDRPEGLAILARVKAASEAASLPARLAASQQENRLYITISVHPETGAALEVVKAVNNKIYSSSGEGCFQSLRAWLAPDDSGLWLPEETDFRPLFPDSQSAAANLINYVLGQDMPGWRSRKVKSSPFVGERTWRLGSAGESKALIAGAPAARHHLLYSDLSYLKFKEKMANRRHMVYSGTNDGVFHALNAGFYRPVEKAEIAYSQKSPLLGDKAPAHELGSEIWGFIPPGLLPRLASLATPHDDSGVEFNYLKPVIADIKANGRWLTALIGGVRITDKFASGHSEFFAFDITDPETEPELLWIFKHKDLGLVQVPPIVVANNGQWYALIANGPPSGDEGEEGGKIFILNAASGQTERVLNGTRPGGFFTSAFSPIAPDYLIRGRGGPNTIWSAPMIYLGQERQAQENPKQQAAGGVYRLSMIDQGSAQAPPKALSVKDWDLNLLFDSQSPVIGAVNSALDANGSRWVFFASGSLNAPQGQQHYLYGLKEPLNENGYLSFQPVRELDLLDVSGLKVFDSGKINNPPAGITNYEDLYQSLLNINHVFQGYKRALASIASGDQMEESLFKPPVSLSQPKLEAIGNGRSMLCLTIYTPSAENHSLLKGRSRLMVADAFTGLPAPYMRPWIGQLEADEKNKKIPGGIYEISGYLNTGSGLATESFIIKTDKGTALKNIGINGIEYSIFIDRRHSLSSGLISWSEVAGMDFSLTDDQLAIDINGIGLQD